MKKTRQRGDVALAGRSSSRRGTNADLPNADWSSKAREGFCPRRRICLQDGRMELDVNDAHRMSDFVTGRFHFL
jgi:hypothetical protein